MEFIPRKTYTQIKKHLAQPEISLILGPRQAGKTTIMEKLAEELKNSKQTSLFFNLDIIEDRQFFQTQHTLLDRIEKGIGKKPAVVFIDEISRLENAGLFLKGLYDLKTQYKFIVSGSGSLELKANILEPLTGRKKIFYCFPLSFTEFTAYKLKVDLKDTTKALDLNPHQCQRLVEEYLTYGGYPRVALAQTHQEKTDILSEIFLSYLEKDIRLLLKVEKERAFENLVRVLASQVGNLVNRVELSSTLGINEKTLKKYLYFLEKTFVVNLVNPFFRNARKELTKSPKIYFCDLGLLRLAQGRLSLTRTESSGSLFENACFLRLKELGLLKPPQFWRTKSGAEVDFIIFSPKTGKPIPVEIKLSPGKKPALGKSLISFLKEYQPEKAFIYTKETKLTLKKLGTKVEFVPYHHLVF